MKSFKDTEGREWIIAITTDSVRRVRAMLNIDLLDIVDSRLIEKLVFDPILLCDVIYVICKPEADKRNISDEDFGRAMAGDAIDLATKAFLEDLVDFSPSPKDRANLRQILTKTFEAIDRARDAVEARIAEMDVDRIVSQALEHASGSSGTPPGCSDSIPAPSP